MSERPTVSVLIPVFNEEKTVKEIIDKLLILDHVDEIVIVNDCSTDHTEEVIKTFASEKIIYDKLPSNQGKTAAIRRAKELATKELCIIQDADLEYDPEEILDVLYPIFKGKADVVYGSRFMIKKAARVLYFYHYIANKSLTFLSNLLTNINFSDIETCYKAIRTDIFKPLPLTSKGFGMEVEITAMVSKLPLRVYEVPISYYGRTYEEGKKIQKIDGVMALLYILYFNLIAPFFGMHKQYIQDQKERIRKL